MQKTVVTNVCDLCDTEDDGELVEVTTHVLIVDHEGVELEACGPCWPADEVGRLLAAGRALKKRKGATKRK